MAPVAQILEIRIGSRYVLVVATVLVVGVALLFSFTDAETHVRFALTDPTGYLSVAEAADNESADLYWTEEQIALKNEVSSDSLGLRPRAAERLYCFSLSDGRVVDFRLADVIFESDTHSASGECESEFGRRIQGFSHTHPRYNDELSATDRSTKSSHIQVTCIQYDTIEEIGERVYGLRCWEIGRDDPEDLTFEELDLAIVEAG